MTEPVSVRIKGLSSAICLAGALIGMLISADGWPWLLLAAVLFKATAA